MLKKLQNNLYIKILTGLGVLFFVATSAVSASTYGTGTYGTCQFGSCSLSITSNGLINLNVTPTIGGSCTVQSDTVSVLTDNSAGFTLSLANNSNNPAMINGIFSINPSSGTFNNPVVLANNTWGYRVDGAGSFGLGPTTAQSNVSPNNTTTYAGTVANNQTADTVITTSSAADPAINTTFWYGLCADTNTASGSYTSTVIYTAITN